MRATGGCLTVADTCLISVDLMLMGEETAPLCRTVKGTDKDWDDQGEPELTQFWNKQQRNSLVVPDRVDFCCAALVQAKGLR